jgi:replicative DNA helicase
MNHYETALIGYILLESNPALYACKEHNVSVDSFESVCCKLAYEAIDRLSKRGRPIDTLTVGAEIEGTLEVTLDDMLDSAPTITHVDYYAEQVKTAERTRRLSGVLACTKQDIDNGLGVDDAIKAVQAELIELADTSGVQVNRVGDLREDKIEQWKAAQTHGFIGVPFTLPAVNKSLGGWRKGCVGIMAGYRGEGKSTLMRQNCLDLAKAGKGVGLFTLEDPADIACASMVGNHADISVFGLDTGRCNPENLARIDEAWQGIGDIPLFISSGSLGIDEIDTAAQLLKMKHGIEIIFVDHVQYIAPLIMKGMSRNDTMAYYSQRFSAMAKKLDIPVVLASQLSRSSEKENRKPKLSDLRDSGTLEQDARQILLLYFDGEKGNHVLEVSKNNFGESRKEVEVKRVDGRQRFIEVNAERTNHADTILDEYGDAGIE